MSALEKLLAPYLAASGGTPSTNESMMADPIYSLLFPDPSVRARNGQNGVPGMNAPRDIIKLARQLERKGFDVGGLEGFQGQGPINSGHVDNSYHYKGRAMDVNYYGGGRWKNEGAALNWLNKFLSKKYNPTELLWQTDDHYDHLHFAL